MSHSYNWLNLITEDGFGSIADECPFSGFGVCCFFPYGGVQPCGISLRDGRVVVVVSLNQNLIVKRIVKQLQLFYVIENREFR